MESIRRKQLVDMRWALCGEPIGRQDSIPERGQDFGDSSPVATKPNNANRLTMEVIRRATNKFFGLSSLQENGNPAQNSQQECHCLLCHLIGKES